MSDHLELGSPILDRDMPGTSHRQRTKSNAGNHRHMGYTLVGSSMGLFIRKPGIRDAVPGGRLSRWLYRVSPLFYRLVGAGVLRETAFTNALSLRAMQLSQDKVTDKTLVPART